MFSSNCVISGGKKSRFTKELETSSFSTDLLANESSFEGIFIEGNTI